MQLAILYFTSVLLGLAIADDSYLSEKPSYLQSCKQTDSNFGKCFAKNFQVTISEWKDGVPGLKTIGSLDPSYFKKISIVEDNNNPLAQINIELSDIYLHGISKMKVQEASFDAQKTTTKLKFSGKRLKINSKYNIQGRILSIPLTGSGNTDMDIDDVEIAITMRLKLRKAHDVTFADLEKLRLEITKIGGYHIQLDNLFNGQEELGTATNEIINQNWKAFYEVLSPAITKAIEENLTDRFAKLFNFVPASYFIDDLSL